MGAALAGSAVYVALWLAGLGHHDPLLLVVAPLPFLIALSLGYAGAMNAAGDLSTEGALSIAESLLIALIAVVVGATTGEWLVGSLVALVAGRAAGTVARAVALHRYPRSRSPAPC